MPIPIEDLLQGGIALIICQNESGWKEIKVSLQLHANNSKLELAGYNNEKGLNNVKPGSLVEFLLFEFLPLFFQMTKNLHTDRINSD